jgi:asparagine synthetase B (glutamine-hydrolysing)
MLAFGHRTGRRILWQGIECVSPGEIVFHCLGRHPQRIRFWLPENVFCVDERLRIELQPVRETQCEASKAVEESLAPILKLPNLAVPCGGGVDSSFLACYAARERQAKTPVWCINQPDAKLRESDWMDPFSRDHGFTCTYSDVNRESFIKYLLESLAHSEQPLPGPNFVGGKILGKRAQSEGVEYLLSGELCDTVFGGLSGFYHLSPKFRILRQLSRLKPRIRLWLGRALADVPAWLLELMHVGNRHGAALYGGGDLENAEIIQEATSFRYDGQSSSQYMADVITWMQMRTVPSALHAAFYERMDAGGPAFEFPFAHPNIMRLGIHLPYHLKRRAGHNKWLWRTIAAKVVGNTVAFRRKESFPTQTEKWLDKIPSLLDDGFLEELLCVDIATLHAAIPKGDTSRWTLANCELWGRLHCHHESTDSLYQALL